jgi:Trypsin-co-occurring domain 2
MNEHHVPIAAFIEALRDELTYAVASAENRPFQFGLGPVDVELSIEATFEAGGSGRTRLWVVSGVSAEMTAQKLRLSLTPVQTDVDHAPGVSEEDADQTRLRPPEPVVVSRESLPEDIRRRFEEDEFYR